MLAKTKRLFKVIGPAIKNLGFWALEQYATMLIRREATKIEALPNQAPAAARSPQKQKAKQPRPTAARPTKSPQKPKAPPKK